MDIRGRVAVVTGGARGIGRALCAELSRAGARGVVVADRDGPAARQAAAACGGEAFECDVAVEAQVQALAAFACDRYGQIDLFCSNAGVTAKGGLEASDEEWERNWRVNVLSHVYAARAVVPAMVERGEGYFLVTASAAGLLTEIGSAPYSVTKHGTVAFAEWLSVHYRRRGLKVSALCPAGVATEFLDLADPVHQFLQVHSITAEEAAERTLQGIAEEHFLILPHAEVAEFFAYKGQDYDRWLHQFSRIREKIERRRGLGIRG